MPESQINVRKSILEKEFKHKQMISEMAKYSSETNYKTNKSNFKIMNKEIKTENYHLLNGDCVEQIKKIENNKADLVVFSPPFAELYVYSDKKEDMGNVSNYKEFEKHFRYLIPELKRTLKQGRICAVHCMDLPIQKGKEGFIGLRDFSGMLIDWFTKEGFIYHAKTTIWKNPVTEMQRTKALGLLHKTIKKDSFMSRVGIPDYILFFRNGDGNETPIQHQDKDPNQPNYLPVDLWQKYASPVWMDVDYKRTLQYRSGRDGNDEKHICPLQLDTIERIIHLYTNEGETVLSPFGGIGSEGFQTVKMNRKKLRINIILMNNIIDWKTLYFKKSKGMEKLRCPSCDGQRTDKKDKSLVVYHNDGVGKCFYCDSLTFRDDIENKTKKEYKLPSQQWRNYTKLSDNMVKYLESRNISQSTAINLGWTEETYYQPSLQKQVNNIVFNIVLLTESFILPVNDPDCVSSSKLLP